MLILYKTLIRSKLEYCCALWDSPKISDIQALENVQRKFTRKIQGLKDFNYWERLEKLHLQSLQRRRERYSIILMWKMANDEAPNNIGIRFYATERLGLRAEVPTSPKGTQMSIATKRYNSFAGRATRLWNTLPKTVNSAKRLESFKVHLGEWMKRFPDRPPVSGYSRQNNNSILEWSLGTICAGDVRLD